MRRGTPVADSTILRRRVAAARADGLGEADGGKHMALKTKEIQAQATRKSGLHEVS
jgi:hypothetical protein